MKVKELMENLKGFNPESEVIMTVATGVTENVFAVEADPENASMVLISGSGGLDEGPVWHEQRWCDHCDKASICQKDFEGNAICFECKEAGGADHE